jgi:HAD superfamily hydrolase (TIGR01509 family)
VAFNRAFEEAGLDWQWSVELYGKLLTVTGGKERIKYYLEQYRSDYHKPADFEDFVAGLHQAKTRHYTRMLDEGAIPLRTGVRRVLASAREAGYRLAIATTTTPANVDALLRNSLGEGWEDWFELIAAGDIVPAKKPAPDIYHYALRKMQLRPEACLAFEDSHNGLLSSQGADLPTVITVNDYTRDHDFRGALIVLSDFGEPDKPFTVLAGDAGGEHCVTMDLLTRLHASTVKQADAG